MKGKAKTAGSGQVQVGADSAKNYFRLGKSMDELEVSYIYLDTDEMLLESLNETYLLGIEDAYFLEQPGEKYKMVLVRVWKDNEEDFLKAMEDLKDVMLFHNCRDYATRGVKLVADFEAAFRKELESKGYAWLPTGGIVLRDSDLALTKEEWESVK